jgi:hypothetical protein
MFLCILEFCQDDVEDALISNQWSPSDSMFVANMAPFAICLS